MRIVGDFYARGDGVEKSFAKAREWYEKAIGAGDSNATVVIARLNIEEASDNGQHSYAFQLQSVLTAAVTVAEEVGNGAAELDTAAELNNLAWYALMAGKPENALAAIEQATSLDPDQGLWVETNRAHALMYLDRANEAREIYLAHKGKSVWDNNDKPWQQVIAEDFSKFQKAGLAHPQMDEIASALGIGKK